MFDYTKVKVGDKLYDNYHKTLVTVKAMVPYSPAKHGSHTDPDGSAPAFVIDTNVGWFSAQSGLFGGGRYSDSGLVHLESPMRKMFHAVVRSESENLELPNLFNDEEEAKTYATKHGFEYVCKGTEVRVPN